MIDFEQDKELPATAELQELEKLIQQYDEVTSRLENLADLTKKRTEEKRILEESIIPDLMKQVGMEKFTTTSGRTVTMKEFLFASVAEKNKPIAYKWLRDNNFGDLIKNELTISFDAGQDDQVIDLMEQLSQYNPSQKRSVHASTLKAFIKEQRKKGVEIPEDIFGVYELTKAVVK